MGSIVIVDDEPLTSQHMKQAVEAIGHDVLAIVTTGEAAIETASRLRPDLVLLDIHLSGSLDGTRAGAVIARLEIPVIYVSARREEEALRRACATGPYAFLPKPCTRRDLQTAVEIALRRSGIERALRERVRATEAAVHERDVFLAVASHDLRTPIAALKLNIQAARRARAGRPDVADGTLLWLDRSVDRLSKLVDELFDLARVTCDPCAQQPEAVDLPRLIRDVVSRFEPLAAVAGSAVHLDVTADAVGHWSRLGLDRALTNLLVNAAKFGAGRSIVVRAGTTHEHAWFSVTDHGIGIAREEQSRIFERFERGADPQATPGLGLGLWIVRQIARSMNGDVGVRSDVGAGATFTVRVPLRPAPQVPQGADGRHAPTGPRPIASIREKGARGASRVA